MPMVRVSNGGTVPQSMMNTTFTITTSMIHQSINPVILNTSNIHTLKCWSNNTAQVYGSRIYAPDDTQIATISKSLTEANAVILDVSAYEYLRFYPDYTGAGSASSSVAYKITA